MNKIKQKLLEKAAETVVKIAQEEMKEWPSACVGIFYQPERPDIPNDKYSQKYPTII